MRLPLPRAIDTRHRRPAVAPRLGLVVIALGLLMAPAPASAAGPRPLFQLPFPCGESWHLATYPGHQDFDVDMTPNSGSAWGRTILAAYGGTVAFAGWGSTEGNYVKLDHGGGWTTLYLHMIEPPPVRSGQVVGQGQQIGRVGSTGDSEGPHLHHEQKRDGAKVETWFNGAPSGITTDGHPPGEPTSGPVDLISHNCGAANNVGSRSAVTTSASGLMSVFSVAPDGRVYTSYQSTVGGAFGGWVPVGSNAPVVSGSLAVTTSGSGLMSVFARSTGGRVYTSYQSSPGSAFGGWVLVGANSPAIAGSPAVNVSSGGLMSVFATASDGRVWTSYQSSAGSSFGGWVAVGSNSPGLTGDVAVTATGSGLMSVFARSTSGRVYTSYQSSPGSAFGGWVQVGTASPTIGGPPAVGVASNGAMQVFATASDGSVYTSWQSTPGSSFGPWRFVNS